LCLGNCTRSGAKAGSCAAKRGCPRASDSILRLNSSHLADSEGRIRGHTYALILVADIVPSGNVEFKDGWTNIRLVVLADGWTNIRLLLLAAEASGAILKKCLQCGCTDQAEDQV